MFPHLEDTKYKPFTTDSEHSSYEEYSLIDSVAVQSLPKRKNYLTNDDIDQ